jgi:hypothetical protein
MGDHSTAALKQLWKREDERFARKLLVMQEYLELNGGDTFHWILNHIDCFVSQSRGNNGVETVTFDVYALYGQDDEVWDKVGQAIGNLQKLKRLGISNNRDHYDDDDEVAFFGWERLARILSHVRQKVAVKLFNHNDNDYYIEMWSVEEVQGLARAIRGHPTITSFDGDCSCL